MIAVVIKFAVIALFGVVVGGGVYLVLFIAEAREAARARAAELAAEAEAGTAEHPPED